MKKLSICLLTAVITLAAVGATPATTRAATDTYNIPGGRVIVIGGAMNGVNCDQILPGINLLGIQFPGVNIPGSNVPDNSLPLPELSIPDQPGNMLPDQPGDTTPDQPETDGSQDVFANQVVKLVNEGRAKAGLSPLSVNNKAVNAVQTRAREVEKSLSHARPDGSSFNTTLTEAGVSLGGAGENIIYGQTTPQQIMEGWMNSSGHGANTLSANYISIGMGHYKNGAGVDYWIQLFIQRR